MNIQQTTAHKNCTQTRALFKNIIKNWPGDKVRNNAQNKFYLYVCAFAIFSFLSILLFFFWSKTCFRKSGIFFIELRMHFAIVSIIRFLNTLMLQLNTIYQYGFGFFRERCRCCISFCFFFGCHCVIYTNALEYLCCIEYIYWRNADAFKSIPYSIQHFVLIKLK